MLLCQSYEYFELLCTQYVIYFSRPELSQLLTLSSIIRDKTTLLVVRKMKQSVRLWTFHSLFLNLCIPSDLVTNFVCLAAKKTYVVL